MPLRAGGFIEASVAQAALTSRFFVFEFPGIQNTEQEYKLGAGRIEVYCHNSTDVKVFVNNEDAGYLLNGGWVTYTGNISVSYTGSGAWIVWRSLD